MCHRWDEWLVIFFKEVWIINKINYECIYLYCWSWNTQKSINLKTTNISRPEEFIGAIIGHRIMARARGGTNTLPDPDTSGNRYAKPYPRYPIRLSAKVLISRIANYSIIPFTVWVQGLCGDKFLKSAARSIAWLTTGVFHQTGLNILRSFVNLYQFNPTWSWFQHLYPIPDLTWIFSARSTPS